MADMDRETYALRIAEGRRHAATGSGRQIRIRARLTLGDVATAIGTSEAAVSRWERKQRVPRGAWAAKWAIFLEKVAAEFPAESDAA